MADESFRTEAFSTLLLKVLISAATSFYLLFAQHLSQLFTKRPARQAVKNPVHRNTQHHPKLSRNIEALDHSPFVFVIAPIIL